MSGAACARKWADAHPERIRAASARWRASHPRYIRRPVSRATKARCAKTYRARNRHVGRANLLAYRARIHNAPGRGVTSLELREVLASTAGLCPYCGKRKRLEADHVEPLARGGEHDVLNLSPACSDCNKSKNQTPLLLWLAGNAGNGGTTT